MLATKSTTLTRQALGALPPTPTTATWIGYVPVPRRHRLGGRRRGRVAVGPTGRCTAASCPTGTPGSSPARGRGLVFQANPATGDRRISGTAASPARRRGGPGRRARPPVPRPRGGGGMGRHPVVWSGDELAQPNDPGWADEPGHAADNRWAGCPPGSTPAGLHPPRPHHRRRPRLRRARAPLARVRAALPQLHASSAQPRARRHRRRGPATSRQHASGPMVGLYNVTPTPRPFPLHRLHGPGWPAPYDALGGYPRHGGCRRGGLAPPYAAWWVVERAVERVVERRPARVKGSAGASGRSAHARLP